MPKPILERELAQAAKAKADGKIKVTVLTPGWGSSGYYSPEVVEAAAGLVKVGTPMYLDHASETERFDRPGRSVKDIAAKFVSEAAWDATAQELVAEAQLVPGPYREALVALEDSIGVSINGSATDVRRGEADGRQGPIVEGLAKIDSVDFVTRAGRGGKFTALLESALLEDEVLHQDLPDVAEATASDRMGHLRDVIRTVHSGSDTSAWVRDQDAEAKTVWFDVVDHRNDQPSQTFQQKYRVGDNDVDVELVGKPTAVRAVTQYVPVSPAGSNPTKESKEDTMAKKEIEESEYSRLVESDGRVTTLEAERDALNEQLADRGRRDRATAIIAERATEAKVEFTALEQRGLMADLPVKEDNGKRVLDEQAFTTLVDEAAKDAKASTTTSTGGVTGFGASLQSTGDDGLTESAKPSASPWGRPLAEQKGA